ELGWAEREALTDRQTAEERLLMGLRTLEGVDLGELAPLGLDAGHPRIDELGEAGLIRVERGRLLATAQGRLVLDRVTLELTKAAD
ncbi:MAG TPA: hypothetical protein VHX64_14055, partial [Caulobacteraceae bacterium]|nr:hypothetical protein [Caulobacteraceae bacterium]